MVLTWISVEYEYIEYSALFSMLPAAGNGYEVRITLAYNLLFGILGTSSLVMDFANQMRLLNKKKIKKSLFQLGYIKT